MDQSRLGKKKNMEEDNRSAYASSSEQMLKMILESQETLEEDWLQKGLPKLVDEIIQNYENLEGINHLEGKDLPSKQIVIDILEDLLTVIFPGYF